MDNDESNADTFRATFELHQSGAKMLKAKRARNKNLICIPECSSNGISLQRQHKGWSLA